MRHVVGQTAVRAVGVGLATAVGVAAWAVVTLGAQATDPVMARARQERAAYLETLRELVAVDSGSRDVAGLDRAATLIAGRLRALGGQVDIVPATDVYKMEDTPAQVGKAVVATFRGTGTKRILLLAHMDTVYQPGMAATQPYRVDGTYAYGLGIADDKSGVALAIHAVAILQALGRKDYGTLTVLVNGDEEIGSPGSRALITRLGSEHDVVFSCEGAGEVDELRLTTSGNGAAILRVRGRASHAGAAPDEGRNALVELAHQVLQTRDLSDRSIGMTLNWTIATAGGTRNIIPAAAVATGDARVTRVRDWDTLEAKLRERIARKLVPDTEVSLTLERRRPPLEATAASRALAAYAQSIYGVTGQRLGVTDLPGGGATDAAIAALKSKAPVIEGFGPVGFGAHSDAREYIDLRSVEPRLYLLARMVLDVAQGKAPVN